MQRKPERGMIPIPERLRSAGWDWAFERPEVCEAPGVPARREVSEQQLALRPILIGKAWKERVAVGGGWINGSEIADGDHAPEWKVFKAREGAGKWLCPAKAALGRCHK
jgi:hypothetical protein